MLFLAMYIYFVNATVLGVVATREYQKEAKLLTRELADAEQHYFELSEDLDMKYAKAHGFVEAPRVSYIILHEGEKGISYLSE